MWRRYAYDEDERARAPFYFHTLLDLALALLVAILLASCLSRLLWRPLPPPEEARVWCTSLPPYNVTTREYLHLGTMYMNSHDYHNGHYAVQKRLPVDVAYIMHPVLCSGRPVSNWTRLYVVDAFAASDDVHVLQALEGVALLQNETRYTYEFCLWNECLFAEPLEDWWWDWLMLWSAGVVGFSSVFFCILWIPLLLHRWYEKMRLYENFVRVASAFVARIRTQTARDVFVTSAQTNWDADCV